MNGEALHPSVDITRPDREPWCTGGGRAFVIRRKVGEISIVAFDEAPFRLETLQPELA
jgi:hypothetical protein